MSRTPRTFDYSLKLIEQDGTFQTTTWQKLIRVLEINSEVVQGRPLTAGGVPQVAAITRMLMREWNLKAVEVRFNGNQIL